MTIMELELGNYSFKMQKIRNGALYSFFVESPDLHAEGKDDEEKTEKKKRSACCAFTV